MGLLPVRLQAQNQACSEVAALNSTGVNPVPLCEPSQKGWALERPQAHHQYSLFLAGFERGFVGRFLRGDRRGHGAFPFRARRNR